MTRAVAVLRPEPGNARTAARLAARGLTAIRLPLFAIVPLPWIAPDPAAHDALLLTSANAVRHAGTGLAGLSALPVVAVGEETAAAARAAGLRVALTGDANADAAIALAQSAGFTRLLHLVGRERADTSEAVIAITVYASEALDIASGALATLNDGVALLHSRRAAEHFAALARRDGLDCAAIRIAAISVAVGAAVGAGWGAIRVADRPTDEALVDVACDLAIDRPGARGDKTA